jgi:alkylation response protein AidB-like acyl-CoA dehydrogenase
MGIDVDTKYDGTGASFFTTMLVIEELSKVDPSVGAMVEVHNSLAVETISKYANEAQKQEWLPRLANDMVRCCLCCCVCGSCGVFPCVGCCLSYFVPCIL